jgi:predicted component of type VI protein secretion system
VLKGGAAEFLADVITRRLGAILNNVAGDAADKPKRQLELVNELLGFGSSTWARTRDLRINSPALYQLSYRGTAWNYSQRFAAQSSA